ncbi:MAG: M48 family metalloprotease [Burkholderiales bacterium]|nr:M48 family metalloprotease [Burkholderiales bacterium]
MHLPHYPRWLAPGLLMLSLLGGCASVADFPAVDQAALTNQRQHIAQVALASWQAQQARLYLIRERLWLAATRSGQCVHTRVDRGAFVEMPGDLPAELKEELAASGVQLADAVVIAVAPQSPADQSGIHAQDRIVHRGEEPIALPSGWFESGEVALDLHGEQGDRRVTVGARPLCDVEVVLDDAYSPSAFYDGTRIHVAEGMLQALADDDSLAFVLAHELGHATAQHALWARLYNPSASRNQEREADQLGIRLVARAGYDLRRVADVWERIAKLDPTHVGYGWLASHPMRAERELRLQSEIARIQTEAMSATSPQAMPGSRLTP